MAIVTTSGILLRSMNYSETSKILRVFTSDYGLTSVIAKGIRRKKISGGQGLELFSQGEITFYEKKSGSLHLFKEFSLHKTGRTLGENILRFTAASILGEIVLVQGTNEKNRNVYEQLRIGLDSMEKSPERLIITNLLKKAWILVATLGYQPEIAHCIHCGKKLEIEEIGKFDLQAGGIICSSCGSDKFGPRLGPIARSQLRGFFTNERIDSVRGQRGHLILLRDFIDYHLTESAGLKSFDVLSSLLDHAEESQIEGQVDM